jgi:23S rRNA pseudouridine1911/1915/1917 synthase
MNTPPIDVLAEEGPLLAVNKPAGVLTQGPPGVDSIVVRIKAFLKQHDEKPGKAYLGVPHRLDRPVSGAMVFAKHSRAARRLAEQFEARTPNKTYWACVAGQVEPAQGEWRDWVRKIPDEALAEVVAAESPDAREAVLRYRTLGAGPWGTWLEIELVTGRMHQIRLQSSSRGWPVVGDALYGAAELFGPEHEDPRAQPIALHARSLALAHPMTHEPVEIWAPLPPVWREFDPRFAAFSAQG